LVFLARAVFGDFQIALVGQKVAIFCTMRSCKFHDQVLAETNYLVS